MDLKKCFDANIKKLVDAVQNVDFKDEEVYKMWLAQTYYQTKYSEAALVHIGNCSSSGEIRDRWHQHAKEESGHENLALKDLKALGGNIEDYPELMENKAIYRCQWFNADQLRPESCFGWILALEGVAASMPKEYVQELCDHYGNGAMSFVRVHTLVDEVHLASAFETVSLVENQEDIIENMNDATYFYCQMLEKVSMMKSLKVAA